VSNKPAKCPAVRMTLYGYADQILVINTNAINRRYNQSPRDVNLILFHLVTTRMSAIRYIEPKLIVTMLVSPDVAILVTLSTLNAYTMLIASNVKKRGKR